MYSGRSGLSVVFILLAFTLVLTSFLPYLPILQSKHFNHIHPYIEITTMISDYDDEKFRQLKKNQAVLHGLSRSPSIRRLAKHCRMFCG